jgi:hypothetical protein
MARGGEKVAPRKNTTPPSPDRNIIGSQRACIRRAEDVTRSPPHPMKRRKGGGQKHCF